jgi:hypothetical protein
MAEMAAAILAACMGCAGFGLLALSQREHWLASACDLPYPSPGRIRDVRALAALLATGALVPCVAGHGGGFGTLLWMLLLAASAFAIAFTLAWRPRRLAPLAFLMCDIV